MSPRLHQHDRIHRIMCTYVCMYVRIHKGLSVAHARTYVCTCMYVYTCTYVCIHFQNHMGAAHTQDNSYNSCIVQSSSLYDVTTTLTSLVCGARYDATTLYSCNSCMVQGSSLYNATTTLLWYKAQACTWMMWSLVITALMSYYHNKC